MNKFEEMLDRLINEDRKGAEELFHDIVVEKSRNIYESLLDEEDPESEFGQEDEVGGDATDDLMSDLGMDDDEEDSEEDFDDSEMDDEDADTEDRIEDLEDALEDLRAEFEKLMDDEDDSEEDFDDSEMDDEEDSEEEDFDDSEIDDEDDEKSDNEAMREYVEKVTVPKGGDNGDFTKSAVASKNNMGGTADNIARNDSEKGVEANKGKLKGSALNSQSAKQEDAGNINKPGARASKSMKNYSKGHGAEKKGGSDSAENTKSTIGARRKK